MSKDTVVRFFGVSRASVSVFVIFVFLNFLSLFPSGDGFLLDLFAEKDRHGLSIRVDVSDAECSNFPGPWVSRAASVNTLGSCVQFYDEASCKGSLTIIQPFHTIHQMDMSLINFANRIQSASSCGPKIKTGRFVIQNADDASILTVTSKYGGFARAFTTATSKVITKAQQWDIIELSNSEYSLKPREFGDNYPVSYDEESLKKGQIKKKLWKLMSVGRGRYLVKNEPSQRCLYKTEDSRVEEHDCRIWSPNQEWVLKEIFGNTKPTKSSASVGPGLNFNILSKVASFVPPTKPPPQYPPIYINASSLATLKRRSTPAPYVVRKKIRRGPRPLSRPIAQLANIRPQGIRERPALSSKFANNNKFLLVKNPLLHGGNSTLAQLHLQNQKEFVPSDDRVETYAYYQHVLKAHALQAELIKQAKEQALKNQFGKPQLPPKNEKKKKQGENDDEDGDGDSDEEENDEGDKEDGDGDKRKKKKNTSNRKKKNKEEESEEEHDDEDGDGDSDEDDEDERKKRRKTTPPPPPPTRPPYNPYVDINYASANVTAEAEKGFFKSVLTNLKSLVPMPKIPFLSSSSSNSGSNSSAHGQHLQGPPPPNFHQQQPQFQDSRPQYHDHEYEEKPKKKHQGPKTRPPRPQDYEDSEEFQSRPAISVYDDEDRPSRPRPRPSSHDQDGDGEFEGRPPKPRPSYDDSHADGPPPPRRRPRPSSSSSDDDGDGPPPSNDYEGDAGPPRRPRPRPRPKPNGDDESDDGPPPSHDDDYDGPPPPKRRPRPRPSSSDEYSNDDMGDYGDGPPPPRKGPKPGLRLPKRKSSTTTTTEKSTLWGFFG